MMFETIKGRLERLDCDGWELTESTKRGWEFYFIRHQLDQNRAVETKTYTVHLYKALEGGALLGSATGEISPTASEAEIDKTLETVLFQASLVKNPYYTLQDRPVDIPEKTARVDVEKIAEDFLRAFRAVRETETEDINSYEVFVSEIDRRFENSKGVRYRCVYPTSSVDLVVNARRGGHEIELYRFYTSGTCDAKRIRADVEQLLRFGKDRLVAEPTPKLGKGAVVFSTADAEEIYSFFAARTNAAMKVRQLSDWEPGKPICEGATGDLVTLEALSSLPNSSKDFPVDAEGAVIRDRFLIRDGIVECFWGDRQFSSYLGLKDSSNASNFRVSGGRESAEAVRSGDYLEVVEFSDFQVDSIAGDIAGEIRLGYWHHGGETTVVTGGSVTGNMLEAMKTMRFSAETVQYDGFVIPAVTRLEDLRITGVKDLD